MATPKKTDQGTWRIQIEVGGVRDSATFDTKREADEWAARKRIELKAVSKGGPGSNKTLLDVLRRYADEKTPDKRGNVKELIRLKAFENTETHKHLPLKKLVQTVTSDDIGKWRNHRLKLNARGSVLRDLGLLSSVLGTAKSEWKWIKANPCEDVSKPANPDHRERLISGPEIRAMLRRLGYRGAEVRSVSQAVAQAFLLALRTGMRAGEICGLTWPRVRADYVILLNLSQAEEEEDGKGTTKTGKGRDVPLSPGAQRIIARMKGWDADSVFGLQSQTLDTLFRRARVRAKLSGFTFHDSRHTACTHLARKIDVLDLCKMMGWVKTTQALTYYNPKASDIARRLA
jgi:integrase